MLPKEAKARKDTPIFSGVIRYFPRALAAVAALSKVGNDQHNPGKPLHWDRSKSTDEHDALVRHLFEAGTVDTDGMRHSAKVAWRALAALEKELEAAEDEPIPYAVVEGPKYDARLAAAFGVCTHGHPLTRTELGPCLACIAEMGPQR